MLSRRRAGLFGRRGHLIEDVGSTAVKLRLQLPRLTDPDTHGVRKVLALGNLFHELRRDTLQRLLQVRVDFLHEIAPLGHGLQVPSGILDHLLYFGDLGRVAALPG